MSVLTWDTPPKAESASEWAARTADGAPPGVYTPNMDRAWMQRWKARLFGTRRPPLRVEVRKTACNGVQMVLKISESGRVLMSLNGTADFGPDDLRALLDAYTEALDVMAGQRYRAEADGSRA